MSDINSLFENNYYEYCLFYLLGFFIFYFLDNYFFSTNESKTKVVQENEKEEIDKYKKKFKKEIEKMPHIDKFYMVIGLGGVGSKVVMDLIRSGVKKIRVMDFDIVTLSSLNRHAFANRSDVGKYKTDLIKEYCKNARPDIIIEPITERLSENNLEKMIIENKPDIIIDCIDDLNTKADLHIFAYLNKLKIFSSMGAAGKCDPSTIRYSKFNEIKGDIMHKRLKYIIKKKLKEIKSDKINPDIPPNFDCVYSFEKNQRELAELDDEQLNDIKNLKIMANGRIRSLPVFACMPSSFGHCLSLLSMKSD